ncbi:MAG: hypothetical protein EAZ99_19855 [Alphaproteobacteria bacterium]|nr:MAG: hypothetical protein EAZ99_19855 [Alphaproteobacteria bacterium]
MTSPIDLTGLNVPLLLPYQQRPVTLLDSAPVLVIEKSRRIGMTWGIAAMAVLKAATKASARGSDVHYIGYEREMTREFIEVCADWARLFNDAAEEITESVLEDGDKSILVYRIKFASGFSINAYSSRPRNLRGRQGMVIIDEAAFHDDLDELLKAAMALLVWGGQVIVISTHDGAANPFALLCDKVRAGLLPYQLLRITFDEAVSDGLYRRICLTKGLTWSPEAEAAWCANIYSQYGADADEELRVIPAAGARAFFDPAHVARAFGAGNGWQPGTPTAGLPTYIGNDIAAKVDQWVATVVQRRGPMLTVVEEVVRSPITYKEQDLVLDELVKRWRPQKVCMDETGVGQKPVEDATRRYGKSVVEGVAMSPVTQLALADCLAQHLEAGTIIGPNDEGLRTQLLYLKRASGANGRRRLVTPRQDDHHCDRAWALMLAVAAADLGSGLVTEGFREVPAALSPDDRTARERLSVRRDWRW